MVTHQRVLSESYPMNTNMTELRWFSKNLCFVLWTKVAFKSTGKVKQDLNPRPLTAVRHSKMTEPIVALDH